MTVTGQFDPPARATSTRHFWGPFWLLVSVLGAGLYFQTGLGALLRAWATPEYSYGPLVPLLSAYMFLRELRDAPPQTGPVTDRGLGIAVLTAALLLGGVGRMIQISDLVAYAVILWVEGMLLLCFGWRYGRRFWPPVLHLVFMLPLPDVLYYGLSTYLQGVSSQLGVAFLQVLQVPVFLDGNVIDLGTYKLQVAEACSGLRYLFPILSFSYFFSVLYRGPVWHKVILLLAAAPITVLMNSVRIGIAGVMVDDFGTAFVEGLTHFFEGWVIFVMCVLILFALARVLMFFQPQKLTLVEALDLDVGEILPQFGRLRLLQPSSALIGAALLVAVTALAWQAVPSRPPVAVERQPFSLFPRDVGGWLAAPAQRLDPDTARILAADDYYATELTRSGEAAPVDLFMAWYKDQMTGGTHSPTDCLPAAGWEIAKLDQVTVEGAATGGQGSFTLNRALIQKGLDSMLVYYWYDQQGQKTPSAWYSRVLLTWSKATTGRSDGALIRLVTPILDGGSVSTAEFRLQSALPAVLGILPRFVPGAR